ncbi:unnamed protein product [Moneuplotes crassus]|uniref:GAR domain-containing protein n=1 Tax=Euplotes crassus TaxID=5936 RepID=A0AAD2D7L1_EUPCR|nr:unnamed protein product [Moneuplotes crassus]
MADKDQNVTEEFTSSQPGYKVTTKTTTYKVSNGSGFTDHSESMEFSSTPTKTTVHEKRIEITHSFGLVQSEMNKLGKTKDFYSRLRDRRNNFDSQVQSFTQKIEEGGKGVKSQVKNLESQTDTLSLDLRDISEQSSKKEKMIAEIQMKSATNLNGYKKKEAEIDETFTNTSKDRDTQLIEYLEKLRKAQKEMEALVENSVKDREAIRKKLEDVQRQVIYAKDPKFLPESLRNSEKEKNQLSQNLDTLKQNVAALKVQVEEVETRNDKLEREVGALNTHNEINKPIQEERESLIAKTQELSASQHKLYTENIQKIKLLHQLELEITERRTVFPILRNKLNASIIVLDENIDGLEKDIEVIDDGTKQMDKKVDDLRSKVQSPVFVNALERIQQRLKNLNGENQKNGGEKDQVRKDTTDHRLKLNEVDFFNLTQEEIRVYITNLKKVKDGYNGSNKTKDDHMREYKKLQDELDDLQKDILAEYEKNIKVVHKRSDANVKDTSSNLDKAKVLITELGDTLDSENPAMGKFIKEYENARNQHSDVKGNNGDHQRCMTEFSNRNMDGDDHLTFLITLNEDQLVTDSGIQDNKKNSENLLAMLMRLKNDLDEEDKSAKDDILNKAKNLLMSKYKKLEDLEEKLKELEDGEMKYFRSLDLALQIVGKDHPEYSDLSAIDKNSGVSKQLRKDKNKLEDEFEDLKQLIDNADPKAMTMKQVLEIQSRTEGAVEEHGRVDKEINDGLNNLRLIVIYLDKLLVTLRDRIKKESDEKVADLSKKIEFLVRFLTPENEEADSIQRPTKLKELLDQTSLSRDDPEYAQYKTYVELVTTNLTKCNYAANDLKRLNKDTSKVLKEYDSKSLPQDVITDQIEYIQESAEILKDNEKPSEELTVVVTSILKELDSEKEEEIRNFLDHLKSQREQAGEEKLNQLLHDVDELEKLWKAVNQDNDSFTKVLSKAKIGAKSREKVKLADTLIKESEVDQKDLREVKKDIDLIKSESRRYDLSRITVEEIYIMITKIETYLITVAKRTEECQTIQINIDERKKRWDAFLKETEVLETIINEYFSLLSGLREKYEKLIKSHNFCSNSVDGFILVNQKIQENEHYETNEAPCANREQIQAQLGELDYQKNEYAPKVDEYEAYDAAKLKNLEVSEIEALIQSLTSLINSIDNDNQSLDDVTLYLKDERKDFKNGDVYNNRSRIEELLETADQKLQSSVNEFEGLKETLQGTDSSDSKLTEKIKEIEGHIVKAGETLELAKSDFEIVSQDIERENMDTSKLVLLASIIEKLGTVAAYLKECDEIFELIEIAFKELQTELVDLYYSKKLIDMIGVIKMLLERLGRLSDLIDKLIALAAEFNGYTSDNEEEEFVNSLESELAEIKEHHTDTQDKLTALEQEIEELQALLKQENPIIDEEKADQVDSKIGDLSKMIENIEKLVDSKIQRFADMDPYKKFKRREKELNKLTTILSERENTLKTLTTECKADLKNPDCSPELKEIAKEVIEEIEPLEENLDNMSQRMTMLGNEIATCLEKSAKTEMTIEEIFELLYSNVDIKKKLKLILQNIDEFSKMLNECRKKYLLKKAESPIKKKYKAAKGDQVDEMLGNWINSHGCEIEIKRLGGGFYMFGEKKIYAKIINGKLIIRVGGGYMNIDEFMQHYGMMELARQQRMMEMEYESIDYNDIMSKDDEGTSTSSKGAMGIAEAKKNLRGGLGGSFVGSRKGGSPRGSPKGGKIPKGSPRGSFAGRHGSPRNKTMKAGGSPKNNTFKHPPKGMPSVSKIEESLRKMERDAQKGKLKEGYETLSYKK